MVSVDSTRRFERRFRKSLRAATRPPPGDAGDRSATSVIRRRTPRISGFRAGEPGFVASPRLKLNPVAGGFLFGLAPTLTHEFSHPLVRSGGNRRLRPLKAGVVTSLDQLICDQALPQGGDNHEAVLEQPDE
jgi:hypothetical protein